MPASVFSSTTLVVAGRALAVVALDGAAAADAEPAGAARGAADAAEAVADGTRRAGSAREQPRPKATSETASESRKAR